MSYEREGGGDMGGEKNYQIVLFECEEMNIIGMTTHMESGLKRLKE
jgi:hypothetical protein